eukprot:798571-Rhodomonas_salina.2
MAASWVGGAGEQLLWQDWCTQLHWAAWYGHAEAVRTLMDAGSDKEVKNMVSNCRMREEGM